MTATRWRLVLAVLCAGLLVVVGAEFLPAQPGQDQARTPQAVPHVEPANAAGAAQFTMPPISAFTPVLARPLFSRTRRPGMQVGTLPPSSSFTLVGIVISPGDRHALLGWGQPPKIARVTEGEEIDGWTVDEILPSAVIVRHGDKREEVKPRDSRKILTGSSPPSSSVVSTNGQDVVQGHKAHDE